MNDWIIPQVDVLYANLDCADGPIKRPLTDIVSRVQPSETFAKISVRASSPSSIIDLVSQAEGEPVASRVAAAFAEFDRSRHHGVLFCLHGRHHALVLPSGCGWLCMTWSSQL